MIRLRPSFATLFACTAVYAWCTACTTPPPTERPNVLLISIDSLRADHVGALGYDRDTTPHIDRVAAGGVLFERAYSTTSWTLPAHVAMLTGRYDSAHKVTGPLRAVTSDLELLPESFAAADYRTVGFYSGPFLHPLFGFGRGFDEYVDCSSYDLSGLESLGKWSEQADFHKQSHADITNPNVLAAVRSELETQQSEPFFYFVHMWDVHYDLVAPEPYDSMFGAAPDGTAELRDFGTNPDFRVGMDPNAFDRVLSMYDGETRYTDETIGKLLEELKQSGLLEDTIVVITADHGDEFLEHGDRGHRKTLFDEVLRVPLVFAYGDRFSAGKINTPVSIIDIAPTLLDLASLPPLSGTMGRSLAKTLRTGAAPETTSILGELKAPPRTPDMSVVIRGNDKVIVNHSTEVALYFDLQSDPGELKPIAAARDQRAAQLLADLALLKNEAQAIAGTYGEPGTSGALPAPMMKRLRELGYLD